VHIQQSVFKDLLSISYLAMGSSDSVQSGLMHIQHLSMQHPVITGILFVSQALSLQAGGDETPTLPNFISLMINTCISN
jgi:hypothetical protein